MLKTVAWPPLNISSGREVALNCDVMTALLAMAPPLATLETPPALIELVTEVDVRLGMATVAAKSLRNAGGKRTWHILHLVIVSQHCRQ